MADLKALDLTGVMVDLTERLSQSVEAGHARDAADWATAIHLMHETLVDGVERGSIERVEKAALRREKIN